MISLWAYYGVVCVCLTWLEWTREREGDSPTDLTSGDFQQQSCSVLTSASSVSFSTILLNIPLVENIQMYFQTNSPKGHIKS